MNYLFPLYIKSMGKDTVCRVEERKHPHKPAVDFINDVFNPIEKVEKINKGLKKMQYVPPVKKGNTEIELHGLVLLEPDVT
jgi:hypothetical protein